MAKKINETAPYNFEVTDHYKSHEYLIKEGYSRGKDVTYDTLSHFEVKKRNVFDILEIREKLLVKELLPIKYQRMSTNTFAFFRGTADVMNYDLTNGYNSGIDAIICGDAHLANFGFYSSPERQLLFDVNDFDESRVSYWEYDLKRFLVSALLIADSQNLPKEDTEVFLKKAVEVYKEALKNIANLPSIERMLFPNTVENIVQTFGNESDESTQKLLKKAVKKAVHKNSNSAVEKFTEIDDKGKRKFIENSPVTKHISKTDYLAMVAGYEQYVNNLSSNIKLYLSQCRVIDIVRHSVGVGSVGTLCFLMLLQNNDGSYLVLQIKEALPITDGHEVYANKDQQGLNIVNCQKILQSASDPFLGNFKTDNKYYYVRQFRDMKGSIKLDKLDWDSFRGYVDVCIILLARAHSQSPSFPMIIGYLESQDWMADAFVTYSKNYRKQVLNDYKDFLKRLEDE
ncbi:DUF2252 domain-containing protein [Floricoccus penangensis]|uniref:DUF2252 domain-containing protein n=1 Tax=Floricoccus penangensis TaxID=1859475 RepID=A0A9Q5JGV4_9LACT|nr:DUF2252 domain-containing protein [Floricoccus penangensis]OFI46870.1 hypothetical protein BG262_03505 [Floricoccus penangensis]URZ86625.1 DUF2252 family protein [Floricoccus penangensis]